MNTMRLKHRVVILVPFCYIAFLIFGLIGRLVSGDVGWFIIGATVMTWILNKIIAEAFTAAVMWRRLNKEDRK